MNKVCLLGRITADPELRHTPNSVAVTTFTLAVNRRFGEKETDFIDVVAWKKTAEFVASYMRKGSQIAVCGSIQTRTWKDKQDNTRKSVEVVADEVYFADSKKNDATVPAIVPDVEDFVPVQDDDKLPF